MDKRTNIFLNITQMPGPILMKMCTFITPRGTNLRANLQLEIILMHMKFRFYEIRVSVIGLLTHAESSFVPHFLSDKLAMNREQVITTTQSLYVFTLFV
jgi:hypothetical protein